MAPLISDIDAVAAANMQTLAKDCTDKVVAFADGYGPTYHTGGWRTYNKGFTSMGLDASQFTLPEREGYLSLADMMAYYGPFSTPSTITTSHESYPQWLGTSFSREFALGIIAHLQVRPFNQPDTARDTYLLMAVDLALNAHIPNWVGMYNDNDLPPDSGTISYNGVACDWLPFMFSHTARALIAYYEDQFDSTRNALILSSLEELMEICWVEGYRESGGEYGIYYQPGNKVPAPDLSMFQMPSFAWLYSVTGDEKWRTRSLTLLESGIRWNFWSGLKQYDQAYMWSYDGLQYLGLA